MVLDSFLRLIGYFSVALPLCFSAYGQGPFNATANVRVTGKVESIERNIDYPKTAEETNNLLFHVKLRLQNAGSVPLIFFKSEIQNFDPLFASDERFEHLIAKTTSFRTSHFLKKQEWEFKKQELNKGEPPEPLTFILKAGESIDFDQSVSIRLHEQSTTRPISGAVLSPDYSSFVKNGEIWLKFDIETWDLLPIVLNGKVSSSARENFTDRLRKRWSRFGYLYDSKVTTEPIRIDVSQIPKL